MNQEEKFLRQQFISEAQAVAGQPFVWETDVLRALVVASQLQLALRHPANNGKGAEIAERVALDFQATIAKTPAMALMLDQGWDGGDGVTVQSDPRPVQGEEIIALAAMARLIRLASQAQAVLAPDPEHETLVWDLHEAIEEASPLLEEWGRGLLDGRRGSGGD